MDGAIYYQATDADSNYPSTRDRYGMQSRGNGNGMQIRVGYSEKMQTLKVYTGVWRAKAQVEFIVNGEVQYKEEISNRGGTKIFCTTVNYKLDNPDDVAIFRLTLLDMGYDNAHGSTFMFAGTLANYGETNEVEEDDIGYEIMADTFVGKNDAENPNIENCGLGGKDVGGINANSWLSYNVYVAETSLYDLTLRYAAYNSVNPGLTVYVDDVPVASINDRIPATGGWQAYSTLPVGTIRLTEGYHSIRFYYANAGTNLLSIGFKPVTSVDIGSVCVSDSEQTASVDVYYNGTGEIQGITMDIDSDLPIKGIESDYMLSMTANNKVIVVSGEGSMDLSKPLFTLIFDTSEASYGEHVVSGTIFELVDGNDKLVEDKPPVVAGTVVVAIDGDVDLDGHLTTVDLVMIARYIIGVEDLTPDQLKIADADGDGVITTADLVVLARKIVL